MADEKVKKAALQDDLMAMLDTPVEEIVQATPRASRGKRSNWDNLTNEQLMVVYKKIKINEKIAAEFRVGKREEAQFFEITDQPNTNEMTQKLVRGQKIRFTKSGQTVEDIVVGFTPTGTNVQKTFKDANGNEITFRVGGISVETAKNGSKAVSAVAPIQ